MSAKPHISISNSHFGIWKCGAGDAGPAGYATSPYVAWVAYINELRRLRRLQRLLTARQPVYIGSDGAGKLL